MTKNSLITYDVECLDEDIPIRGNCSAVDEEVDKETENWIQEQIEAGNEWAWCCVRVTASVEFDGKKFVGNDFLGACSYKSKQDFIECGYFEDMKQQAKKI